MLFASRWFPIALAVAQSIRYAGMIVYGYWAAAQNAREGSVRRIILSDLERPLFEPYGFCGAWTNYGGVWNGVMAFDAPSFFAATMLYSLASGEMTCADAVMTPRGQIITALFVPPIWFLVGCSVRRLARRRWRPETTGEFRRLLLSLALLVAPVAFPMVILGAVVLFGDPWSAFRLWGHAFWMLYPALLSAERLRAWPFSPEQPERT